MKTNGNGFKMVLAALAMFAILLPTASVSAQSLDPVDMGVKIGQKLAKGAVGGAKKVASTAAKIFNVAGRHDKVTPFVINGKRAYLLDLYDAKGSRCTLDFDLKTRFRGTLYVVGADSWIVKGMEFQRKGNKYGKDPNRGPQVRSGSRVDMTGSRNYFAERVQGWTRAKDEAYPYASILLLEDGLTLQAFMNWLDARVDASVEGANPWSRATPRR